MFHDTRLISQMDKNIKAIFLALGEGTRQLISQINEPNESEGHIVFQTQNPDN